ncbi:hypothetical protein LPB138_04000 [Urechidicola croceus]|uniref:2TM domain-containing protein n=2 Tax=Urechidicola croceus TaxID=1850246 RepID=A0A1D8PBP3_9FLAO|nr:hypothetical protein LPB138_04000 [Urechidicola croceus]
MEEENNNFKKKNIMKRDFTDEDRYIRAQKKVKAIKGFYWHLFWYVAVNIFLIAGILYSSQSIEALYYWGTYSTAIFWGIGLFFHWFGVFGKNLTFSKSWEERKIKEYMDKDPFN